MEYIIWYLFSLLFISFFCLGWRTITDTGKILYFIRAAFETRAIGTETIQYNQWNTLSAEEKKTYVPNKTTGDTSRIEYTRPIYYQAPVWAHPLVLCVACMASFWGTIMYWNLFLFVHYNLHLLDFDGVLFFFIPVIISCSFVNSLLWKNVNT